MPVFQTECLSRTRAPADMILRKPHSREIIHGVWDRNSKPKKKKKKWLVTAGERVSSLGGPMRKRPLTSETPASSRCTAPALGLCSDPTQVVTPPKTSSVDVLWLCALPPPPAHTRSFGCFGSVLDLCWIPALHRPALSREHRVLLRPRAPGKRRGRSARSATGAAAEARGAPPGPDPVEPREAPAGESHLRPAEATGSKSLTQRLNGELVRDPKGAGGYRTRIGMRSEPRSNQFSLEGPNRGVWAL